jgi:hypothetical protein
VEDLRGDLGRALEEIAYVAVGFAILGVQRAQVARRELERCVPGAVADRVARAVARVVGGGEPRA